MVAASLVLGEITTLAKNSPKFASLHTTISMSISKEWKLKEGDKLDWSREVKNGYMVAMVKRVGQIIIRNDSDNFDQDRPNNEKMMKMIVLELKIRQK